LGGVEGCRLRELGTSVQPSDSASAFLGAFEAAEAFDVPTFETEAEVVCFGFFAISPFRVACEAGAFLAGGLSSCVPRPWRAAKLLDMVGQRSYARIECIDEWNVERC
jgi:hypothetical protein